MDSCIWNGWMKIEKVKEVMQHEDEKKAFDLLIKIISSQG